VWQAAAEPSRSPLSFVPGRPDGRQASRGASGMIRRMTLFNAFVIHLSIRGSR